MIVCACHLANFTHSLGYLLTTLDLHIQISERGTKWNLFLEQGKRQWISSLSVSFCPVHENHLIVARKHLLVFFIFCTFDTFVLLLCNIHVILNHIL